MGVVYLAEDERLGRQVALKFLPSAWSQERKALERFRVEARAASSLSHPAICAIFDIGEDGDTPFIVMEALKGETLRERIGKSALKVGDVLDIGVQLADALGAAHAQGIVHRDIKPANIFLGDKNRVKVLDFGLAKLTGTTTNLSSGADTTSPFTMATHDHQITLPGTALGTVSYMSPEQARGEEIDSRTDLFSLGAVLYEMVTGSQAFGGSTTAVVYDAILNRAPRPIAHINPLVPPRLEAVIATSLEKDRELRYQHASDLEAELKRIRRDLESMSFVSSQPLIVPSREPSRTPSEPSAPAAPARKSSWETAAIVVAVLAALFAGAWVWRTRSPSVGERAGNSAVSAPAVTPSPSPPAAATAPVAPVSPVPEPGAAPGTTPRANATPPTPRETARPTAPPPPASPRPLPPPPAAAQPGPAAPRTAAVPPAPSPVPAPIETPVPRPAPEQPAAAATPPVVTPDPAPAPPPPTAVPPAVRATAPAETTPAAPPPAAPLAETDEAAIRAVIRSYEQAIETKDIRLFRSIRPRLSAAAEAVLRNSFSQVDSQEIDVRVETLRIEGRHATARIARRDTLVTSGRRQTQNSTQTLRFEKTDTGWIIAE
jgi:serine/threonine protein kinase